MDRYRQIVQQVLEQGETRPSRTGTRTRSVFNLNYEIDLQEGFPLLTSKRVSWNNVVIELLWFLSGESNTALLKKHKIKFWDPWTDDNGYVPSAYGKYWRKFPSTITGPIDQLRNATELLQRDPYSRRAVVSAWEPGNAQVSPLPPCHAFFVMTLHGSRLNLHLTQRSCDIGIGLPYNIASYALLVHLMARIMKVEPGTFAHSIVDAHIYENHIPALEEQVTRQVRPLPTLEIKNVDNWSDLDALYPLATGEILDRFLLTGYEPHAPVKLPVAV